MAEEPLGEDQGPKEEGRRRINAAQALLSDPLGQAQHVTEETAQKLIRTLESSQPVRLVRSSTLASALLGSVGFALFIVGVESAAQDLPLISNAYGSITVGVILLAATGLLLRRLAGPE